MFEIKHCVISLVAIWWILRVVILLSPPLQILLVLRVLLKQNSQVVPHKTDLGRGDWTKE